MWRASLEYKKWSGSTSQTYLSLSHPVKECSKFYPNAITKISVVIKLAGTEFNLDREGAGSRAV